MKDSYAALDLSDLAAAILFEAQWLLRKHTPGSSHEELERIASQDDLSEWERAWTDDPAAPRIFLPALLSNESIDFVASRRDGKIVAGAIFSHAHVICGVLNVFTPKQRRAEFLPNLLKVAVDYAGDDMVVCYAPDAEIAGWRALGFEPIGPLRDWISRQTSS